MIERLLYGDDGYYTKHVRIGKRGDFFTAPHASPMFGYTVGRFLDSQGVRTVLEVGGGEGYLALDILRSTPLRVISYERSPKLREVQRKILGDYEREGRWRLVDTLERADAYLLNEVLDAFPSNRYVFEGGRWWEIVQQEDGFGRIPSDGPSHYRGPVREGFIYDEGVGTEEFLREILRMTDRLLIFDYGYDEEEFPLLAPRGTLHGYKEHRVLHGLEALKPKADITHFVNFTHIRRVAEEEGFTVRIYMDQTNFLLKYGMLDVFESLSDEEKEQLAPGMKTLMLLFRNHRVMYLQRSSSSKKSSQKDSDESVDGG